MTSDDADDVCSDAWDIIRNRSFHEWTGLPSTCTYPDFDDTFERKDDAYGRDTLGSAKRRTRYRMHVAEPFEEPLKVWFRDDDLVMIDISHPELPYPDGELLERLGDPEARLDYSFDVMEIEDGAWLYPTRGMALFLDAGKETVMRLSLFPPCDLGAYARRLQRDTSGHEYPVE